MGADGIDVRIFPHEGSHEGPHESQTGASGEAPNGERGA
jgi:hypothetical protein